MAHKQLGVTLCHDMKSTAHIDNICRSASKIISSRRIVLSSIYLVFIRPILEDASEVWDNCCQENSKKLEMIQLEAVRMVTCLPKFSSRSGLYFETVWETLSYRRKNKKALYNLSYLHDTLPPKYQLLVEQYEYAACTNSYLPAFNDTFFNQTVKCEYEYENEYRSLISVSNFKQMILKNLLQLHLNTS